jgi:hypothetical protein
MTSTVRRHAGRVIVAVVALLSLGVVGCSSSGSSSGLPERSWGARYATALCARIFGCCSAAEASQLGYTSEVQCASTLGSKQQASLDGVLTTGMVRYDGDAALACVGDIAATSCTALFAAQGRPLVPRSCNRVAVGTGATGAACGDLDVYCQSSDCESGYCAPPSCRTVDCPAGQFCDPTSLDCVPGQAAGASCTFNGECDPSIVCRAGTCGAPLPDQSPCMADTDCASGACLPIASQTSGSVCSAPQPDGAPCTEATECQSGGCNFAASGATCGPPACTG